MQCERHLIEFRLVPDLFRFVTCSMDVQTIGDIPLLGMQKWPLDRFRNRVLKRLEDVLGSLVGLLISAPVLVVAAIAIVVAVTAWMWSSPATSSAEIVRFSIQRGVLENTNLMVAPFVVSPDGRRLDLPARRIEGTSCVLQLEIDGSFLSRGLYLIQLEAEDEHPLHVRRYVLEVY